MATTDKETKSGQSITLPGGYVPEDGKMPGDRVRALFEIELGEGSEAKIISVDGAKYEAAAEKPVVAVQETVVAPVAEAPAPSADPFADKLKMV